MPRWTKKDAWLALCVAIVAIALHHAVNPHGERLRAQPGEIIILTRTVYGWNVERGPKVVKAKDIKVVTYAEDLD